jgi:pyruvate dehydrogenase E1 component alpha subunit/2-oxoisovalerate dehydrogenase E1 component alpha subunit
VNQILRPDGTVADPSFQIEPERAVKMYRGMLTIRIMDERLMALQRQGRIGFYGEARGQEAAVVGTAEATEPQDWIVPALREAGVGVYRGMSLRRYISQIFGNDNDTTRGRQMPCHPCDPAVNYVVMSSCVGTQVPHAVGIAMGMKIAGDAGKAVFGYMGDGATSEADFHVAMNFAGVFKPPVVLICQNNQWAISVPSALQTASETIAVKGLAYGLDSVRVDGNDVLAVYAAARAAGEKARRGGGPTFIECLTYRVSAHTSSDDPSRYRDESVTLEWRTKKDPIARMSSFLQEKGWLSADAQTRLATEVEAEVRDAIGAEEGAPPPPLETLVTDVFEQVPWHLREQIVQIQQQKGD